MSLPDWTWDAACNGAETDLFYSGDDRGKAKGSRESEAKRYCRRCPVWSVCLDYALRLDDPHGIWGGLNPEERRQVAIERKMAPPPPPKPKLVVEKQCLSCGVIQPAAEFGIDKSKKDGLNKDCKECVAEASRRRRSRQAVA